MPIMLHCAQDANLHLSIRKRSKTIFTFPKRFETPAPKDRGFFIIIKRTTLIVKAREIIRHHKTGLILLAIAGLLIVFRSVVLFYTSVTLNNLEKTAAPQPTLLYGIPVDSLHVETGRLLPGQTLSALFTGKGIPPQMIDSLSRQAASILPPGKLKAGQPFTFISTADSMHKPLFISFTKTALYLIPSSSWTVNPGPGGLRKKLTLKKPGSTQT
jgi:hypothetical protein